MGPLSVVTERGRCVKSESDTLCLELGGLGSRRNRKRWMGVKRSRFIVYNENAIQDMLRDGRDRRWESKELEKSTVKVLGNNYNPYQEIIEEKATMKSLQDELHCLTC